MLKGVGNWFNENLGHCVGDGSTSYSCVNLGLTGGLKVRFRRLFELVENIMMSLAL